ncbi:MAG: PTS sugar transporter subunit IIA [Zetaproteobacteria bacterium]|nr:MAG: PTS sugar transporter subunit IIA [Zetaproteobacteria bacterium]
MRPVIAPENVILDSRAGSKRAALSEMIGRLKSMDPDQVMELVMARERLGSTGIGHGVALPHCRMPGLTRPVVVLLRHRRGIDFDAIDGRPVHLVVLLLVPDDDDRGHLDLLARLARRLQSADLRRRLMELEDPEEVSALFREE